MGMNIPKYWRKYHRRWALIWEESSQNWSSTILCGSSFEDPGKWETSWNPDPTFSTICQSLLHEVAPARKRHVSPCPPTSSSNSWDTPQVIPLAAVLQNPLPFQAVLHDQVRAHGRVHDLHDLVVRGYTVVRVDALLFI